MIRMNYLDDEMFRVDWTRYFKLDPVDTRLKLADVN